MGVTVVPHRLKRAPRNEQPRSRRWTREEYHRAGELGLFRPEERLELLDGEIIEKMTQNSPHAATVSAVAAMLLAAFGPGHVVRSQLPMALTPRSEPEPDVLVARGAPFDYVADHPTAADTLLLVEVADTTLWFDRTRKRPAYARAGVREYWILNLRDRQLEVYREPSGSRYRSATVYAEDEQVTPLAAPNATLRVADLLPPVTPPAQP
jgi:Uma2 family endonuclease